MELIRSLFRSVLDPTPGAIPEVEKVVRAAEPSDWRSAIRYLDANRILPLCAAALRRRELDKHVHFEFRPIFRRQEVLTAYANNARMALYGELVKELRSRGVEPVLLKSAALVALLHPELDTHGMSDIDLLVPPEAAQDVAQIITDRGYIQIPADEDSNSYMHPDGLLLLDYHFRFRMFDHVRLWDLLEDTAAAHPALDTVRVFEPNAMLVHLSYHLNAHRCDLGYGPRWILDIGFVLQHWREHFDLARLRKLSPSSRDLGQLLRLVAFFEKEIGLPAPRALRPHIESIEPFTVAEMLRSQRITCWPLTSLRGWARLGACMAGLLEQDNRSLPRFGDPLLALGEHLREQRVLSRLGRQEAAPAAEGRHAAVGG